MNIQEYQACFADKNMSLNRSRSGEAAQSENLRQVSNRLKRTAMALCIGLGMCALVTPHVYADNVDDYVKTAMTKSKIPGMAVAVLRDGKVLKESTYGVASLELGAPTKLDTVYPLASMTKLFTASSIMLLVQEGQLTLDESLTKVLPELPAKWSEVTIGSLLSHTSGLPDAVTDDVNITVISGDRKEVLDKLATMRTKPVGTEVAYSVTGYALLGMIIERTSGMSYQEFVTKRILQPEHLNQASFGDAWSVVPGRTNLYTTLDITKDHSKLLVKDGMPVVAENKISHYGSKYIPDFAAAAGQLNGSIQDLVKWEQVMAEGKLLSPASLKAMSTPYKLKDGSDGPFGLSFLIRPLGAYTTVQYGGGAAVWRFAVPEKHITVLVLTNLQGSNPQGLATDIASLYEPEIAKAIAMR